MNSIAGRKKPVKFSPGSFSNSARPFYKPVIYPFKQTQLEFNRTVAEIPTLKRSSSNSGSYLNLVVKSSGLPTSRDERESWFVNSKLELRQQQQRAAERVTRKDLTDRFLDIKEQTLRNSQHRKEKFNVILNEPLVYAQ